MRPLAFRALLLLALAGPASAGQVEVGLPAEEAAHLLETIGENTKDLDWSVQNDVDFVNRFAQRSSRR